MVYYNNPADFYREKDDLLFRKAKPELDKNGFFGLATDGHGWDRYNFAYLSKTAILRLSQFVYTDGRQSLRLDTLNLKGEEHGSYFSIFSAPDDPTYGGIYNFTHRNGKFEGRSDQIDKEFVTNCFSILTAAHPQGQEKHVLFTALAKTLTSGRLGEFSRLLRNNKVDKNTFF